MTQEQGSKESGTTSNDYGMTPQQVIEAGMQASKHLQSPVYNLVHRMAVNEIIEAWSKTAPKEVNRRESLWQELQALGRTAVLAGSLVSRAQEILERQNQSNSEDRNNEYQGFGLDPDTMTGGDPFTFQ